MDWTIRASVSNEPYSQQSAMPVATGYDKELKAPQSANIVAEELPKDIPSVCDPDFNNDGVSDGIDFSPLFLPDFGSGTQTANGAGNPQGTDMNCDDVVDGIDFAVPFFLTQFGAGAPGASGLSCAGTVPCL